MTSDGFRQFGYPSGDKLQLSGRIYGDLKPGALPFVRLSGLARNSRDFHDFALAVQAGSHPRLVIAFDHRRRGRSDGAPNAETYTIPVETRDILAGLALLGIGRAVCVGASRGALLVYVLAAAQRRVKQRARLTLPLMGKRSSPPMRCRLMLHHLDDQGNFAAAQ